MIQEKMIEIDLKRSLHKFSNCASWVETLAIDPDAEARIYARRAYVVSPVILGPDAESVAVHPTCDEENDLCRQHDVVAHVILAESPSVPPWLKFHNAKWSAGSTGKAVGGKIRAPGEWWRESQAVGNVALFHFMRSAADPLFISLLNEAFHTREPISACIEMPRIDPAPSEVFDPQILRPFECVFVKDIVCLKILSGAENKEINKKNRARRGLFSHRILISRFFSLYQIGFFSAPFKIMADFSGEIIMGIAKTLFASQILSKKQNGQGQASDQMSRTVFSAKEFAQGLAAGGLPLTKPNTVTGGGNTNGK